MHYFDNAATTFPKPNEVYECMDTFYRQFGVNVGRGQFKEASIAYAMMQETRQLLLELFHVKYPYETIFEPSATQALNIVINSFNFCKNDVVYITPFEHNAVLRTLYAKQKDIGFDVILLTVDTKTLQINIDEVKKVFEKQPPNYCFLTHASNSFGCILEVEDICNLAKKYGIFLRAGKRLILRCAQFSEKTAIERTRYGGIYVAFFISCAAERNFLKTG